MVATKEGLRLRVCQDNVVMMTVAKVTGVLRTSYKDKPILSGCDTAGRSGRRRCQGFKL